MAEAEACHAPPMAPETPSTTASEGMLSKINQESAQRRKPRQVHCTGQGAGGGGRAAAVAGGQWQWERGATAAHPWGPAKSAKHHCGTTQHSAGQRGAPTVRRFRLCAGAGGWLAVVCKWPQTYPERGSRARQRPDTQGGGKGAKMR